MTEDKSACRRVLLIQQASHAGQRAEGGGRRPEGGETQPSLKERGRVPMTAGGTTSNPAQDLLHTTQVKASYQA